MEPNDFLSRRFGMPEEPVFEIGDEVVDDYGMKGIIIRELYYIGPDRTPFVLVYYGNHMSSTTADKVKKTGKTYPEMITLLDKLRESNREEYGREL